MHIICAFLCYRGSPAAGRERRAGKIGKREKGEGDKKARVKGKMSLWHIITIMRMNSGLNKPKLMKWKHTADVHGHAFADRIESAEKMS